MIFKCGTCNQPLAINRRDDRVPLISCETCGTGFIFAPGNLNMLLPSCTEDEHVLATGKPSCQCGIVEHPVNAA